MRTHLRNKNAVAGLPKVQNTGYKHCFLIEAEGVTIKEDNNPKENQKKIEKGKPVYQFMYNPESIGMNTSINYEESAIPLTDKQPVNFSHSNNEKYTMGDLILDTQADGLSIEPLIDQLRSLKVPVIKNKIPTYPKRVYFVWGKFNIGTLVLTDIQVRYDRWIDGVPVRARVSLSFLKVFDNFSVQNQEQLKKIEENVARTNIKKKLSEKQIQDGTKRINDYLRVNRSFLPKRIQNVLNDPKSSIRINNETGQVDLLDSTGLIIDNIGTYDGDKFNSRRN